MSNFDIQNIITAVEPPFEPVTVAEAYEHLRWDTETEGSPPAQVYPLETLVSRNIFTARAYVEQVTRRALVQQTLRMVLPSFPYTRRLFSSRWGGDNEWITRPYMIELRRPPFRELLSVQYLDKDEVLQTLAPSNYYMDTESSLVAQLWFRDTFDTDIATDQRNDAVRINWVAGYTPNGSPPTTQEDYAANIPKGIKDAILLQTQLLCDRFDPKERADIERVRDNLLASYTIHTL
jgi:uncharacterized phiE125 gp8 family phage protein